MKNQIQFRIGHAENSDWASTQGEYLLLADKWAKEREKKKTKIWRIVAHRIPRNIYLGQQDIVWLLSIVRSPRRTIHSKTGRLEALLRRFPSEVIALMAWADHEFFKQAYRKGQRQPQREIEALRKTVLAGQKEIQAGAEIKALGLGGVGAIKNADKSILRSVERSKKSTDTKS